MPDSQEPKKSAVKPSLLEQKVLKMMEKEGCTREVAINEIALLEAEARRTAVLDELTVSEPRILKPTCPGCGADPLVIKRLRYEFGDGVVVEILFCHNLECRIAIAGQIVGIQAPTR